MATTKVLGSKPADCFQFRDPNSWICMTELASDVVVEVGEMSFFLHKFPLMSRSGTLQKLINEAAAADDGGEPCSVQLHDVPGGAAAFELAARFCYDVRTELNAANVVPLRCAAEHLRMTEEYGEGNLVEQTEAFLRVVLGSWNDAVRALQACDGVLPHAEDLLVVPRCIDSLASKACADPTLFGWPMLEYYTAKSLEETVIWNGITTAGKPRSPGADWWYKQASSLKLPVYKRLISAMRSKGMSPKNIAGSLMHYAKRHLSGLSRHSGYSDSGRGGGPSGTVLSDVEQSRVLLEEIVALLPAEKGVATTRFLLGTVSNRFEQQCEYVIMLVAVARMQAHPCLTVSEREQLCRLMNCQKLSLEACTHAAQNERLPLRVVVQVLFFEQLRLRTTVAGWFFVSDNVDQASPSGGHYAPRRSVELDFAAGSEEENYEARNNEWSSSAMSAEDIRQRVVELEEECSSMKEEIHRLGKPKGALSRLFRKLGLGGWPAARRQQQQLTSSGDERRKSMSLER
ncbi:hypothetical protein ABZP36_003552 [Zizania latifolia]